MSENCASTLGWGGMTRHHCRLPKGHEARHEGDGAYWWHGNGEECHEDGCRVCAMAEESA